jgi:hypothetical protein
MKLGENKGLTQTQLGKHDWNIFRIFLLSNIIFCRNITVIIIIVLLTIIILYYMMQKTAERRINIYIDH